MIKYINLYSRYIVHKLFWFTPLYLFFLLRPFFQFGVGYPSLQLTQSSISHILLTYTHSSTSYLLLRHLTLFLFFLFPSTYISFTTFTTFVSSFFKTSPSYLKLLSPILFTIGATPILSHIYINFLFCPYCNVCKHYTFSVK